MTISVELPATHRRGFDWARSGRRTARRSAGWTCWLGIIVSASGFTLVDPAMVALGAGMLGASFLLVDLAAADEGGITPITFYSFSAALTGFANFVGLRSLETPLQSLYFLYPSLDDLFAASVLAWGSTVLPVLGFWMVSRAGAFSGLIAAMPAVRGYIPPRTLLVGGAAVAIAAIASRIVAPLYSLGTVATFIYLLPHFVAFTLARSGAQRSDRIALAIALSIATAEATRALLFAYLRHEIVFPFVAFTFGFMLGRRSLRALLSPTMIPVWLVAIVFFTYFGAFGYVRAGSAGGVERLVEVQEVQQLADGAASSAPRQTVISRITSFNQLSQVVRLTRERGFLHGQTFEYLGFALIPRFLWPDKPLIAKGAWFAFEIGQARVRSDGRYSNSINMTVIGELFLNFGWIGALLGAPLFGAFLAALWRQTVFWTEPSNVLGGAFAFYLIWIGFGLAADLQIVVTLLAMYLLFLAAGVPLRREGTRSAYAQRAGTIDVSGSRSLPRWPS